MTRTASGHVVSARRRRSRVNGGERGHAASIPVRDMALLEDKLQIPRPGLAVLRRGRVSELIEAAVSRRVTLITGPAGGGKTVAAAQWAGSRPPNKPAAWLTLDASDAESGRFWRYVTEALARAGALGDQRPLPPQEPGTAAQWLAAALRPRGAQTVLVIDDVHLLAGSQALSGLDELVRHAAGGLRLVLIGRFAPGLALAKLRVAGELADIGAGELAGTEEEIAAYLGMAGNRVDQAWLETVRRQTCGWMAGIRLAVLGGGAGEAAAQAIVADYLEDEVLSRLPARVRQFLLRTSSTEIVSADLAHELTGERAAAAQLDQLSRENGLVQAVHPDVGEYRYHPMLREVLIAALRRELPDEVPRLQRLVASWHAGRGEVAEAVRAAAAVGDWELALRIVREAGPGAMLSGTGPAVERAVSGCPADMLASDAGVAIALAAARLWQGDADGALPHLEYAESGVQQVPAAERGPMSIWIAALRVLLDDCDAAATEPELLTRQWALASRAHEDARGGPGHRALGVLWMALGFAALREFAGHQARTALLHAGSQLSAGGMLSLRERARSWEAVASAIYGDMAAAARLEASVSDGPHGRDPELIPVLALAGALVSLARDEVDTAGTLLDQADLAAMMPRPAGEPGIAVLSGLLRTRLAIADGNLAGARGLVRWLAEITGGPRAGGAGAVVAVTDAEVSLAAGDRDRARATLANLAGTAAHTRPEATIGQARLLIAEEDDKDALKLIDPLLSDPAAGCSINDRISALLTAVIAHRRLGQVTEAAELLEEALSLAEPEDACGPFLASGSPMRSALTVLITPTSRCAPFASRILDRFDGRLPRPAGTQQGTALTDSELAVLRFLPSHMTNQEIAESLFLSINTIKTHLSSVYRKLGVVNRRQAIAQARRLDLL